MRHVEEKPRQRADVTVRRQQRTPVQAKSPQQQTVRLRSKQTVRPKSNPRGATGDGRVEEIPWRATTRADGNRGRPRRAAMEDDGGR